MILSAFHVKFDDYKHGIPPTMPVAPPNKSHKSNSDKTNAARNGVPARPSARVGDPGGSASGKFAVFVPAGCRTSHFSNTLNNTGVKLQTPPWPFGSGTASTQGFSVVVR